MANTSVSQPILVEAYDKSGYTRAYQGNGQHERLDQTRRRLTKPSLSTKIFSAFLPEGYPTTVTRDYMPYQTYDSLQAFFSTIAGLLSSRAVLQGFGVGDSDSSATAAALLTVLQESTGRIATILFAHRFGRAIQTDTKFYRFSADLVNDSALFLDILSPALPPYPKALALCGAGVLRAICGVSGGAAKAELSAHFAKDNNLAELNAKDSSQETLISLMGMLVGSLFIKLVNGKEAVLAWMIVLISLHLWTNYQAVRSVHMTTLNRQRLCIIVNEMRSRGLRKPPLPHQVGAKEHILNWTPPRITFGDKLPEPGEISPEDLKTFEHEPYVIVTKNGVKTIWLKGGCDRDHARGHGSEAMKVIKAWLEAYSGMRWDSEALMGLDQAGWDTRVNALESGPAIRIVTVDRLTLSEDLQRKVA